MMPKTPRRPRILGFIYSERRLLTAHSHVPRNKPLNFKFQWKKCGILEIYYFYKKDMSLYFFTTRGFSYNFRDHLVFHLLPLVLQYFTRLSGSCLTQLKRYMNWSLPTSIERILSGTPTLTR